MRLSGTPGQILEQLQRDVPEIKEALKLSHGLVRHGKQEIYPYQAAALYLLAEQYDFFGGHILEIGTYYGYSASILAQAAPMAFITTLNPNEREAEVARVALLRFINVIVRQEHSWDYLEKSTTTYDMIFVDGDHKRIARDLPWWNRLNADGLFLFHDYTPLGSPRHCPPVYEILNQFRDWLEREFDVLVVDDQGVGMCGFYKLTGDPEFEAL